MDPHELLLTAGRTAAVYLLMLIVMRIMRKRAIGNFTAFDLLVAPMMGEVVDEMEAAEQKELDLRRRGEDPDASRTDAPANVA